VLGFTYNFENPYTDYKNGIDMHFDWGASKFLAKDLHIGLVGYAYQQLTCDSGAGNRVGCFESRVFGIGPQLGLPDRHDPSGLPEREGLQGIRRREPAGRLERVGDVGNLAGGRAASARAYAAAEVNSSLTRHAGLA
jgi:Putative MetA-pathway of phenol degradation